MITPWSPPSYNTGFNSASRVSLLMYVNNHKTQPRQYYRPSCGSLVVSRLCPLNKMFIQFPSICGDVLSSSSPGPFADYMLQRISFIALLKFATLFIYPEKADVARRQQEVGQFLVQFQSGVGTLSMVIYSSFDFAAAYVRNSHVVCFRCNWRIFIAKK